MFTSEKLDKLDKLVDAINNLTINDAGYEFKKVTESDTLGNLTSNRDTVTHTSNVILDVEIIDMPDHRRSPCPSPADEPICIGKTAAYDTCSK